METQAFERLLASGLRLGQWVGWRVELGCGEGEFDVMLLHPSGQAVYIPIFSNGWISARTSDGVWFDWWSAGEVDEQGSEATSSETLFERVRDREPAGDWPPGEVYAGQWFFEADADRLTAEHEVDRIPCVFHRYRPLWTREKKPLIVEDADR